MPRVTVPVAKDPLIYVWTELAPPLTAAAGAYSNAVYESLRSRCASSKPPGSRWPGSTSATSASSGGRPGTCRAGRPIPTRSPSPSTKRSGPTATGTGSTERERLSAEFAERYSTDHLGMDEEFWDRLHGHFTDDELVDLALCVGSWLALGRFNQVFDIDGACRVPAPTIRLIRTGTRTGWRR